MKLAEFMRRKGLSDQDMSALIGAVSESAVRKWKYGERTPRSEVLIRIREATGGEVSADDFLPSREEAGRAA
jgi:transcriptional regulator with XRE-family HTH domain